MLAHRRGILGILCLFLPCFSLLSGFPVASEGRPLTRILIPRGASAHLQHASSELQDFLQRMTDAVIPVEMGEAGGEGAICLGFSSQGLGLDEYVVESEGGRVRLDGGGERGPLYAVYGLLKALGCLWPLPEELWLEIPHCRDLEIPSLTLRASPYFPIRGVHCELCRRVTLTQNFN